MFTSISHRVHDPKKNGEQLKPAGGRIADKISLFERQQAFENQKQTFKTPRSADVSPVRKTTERMRTDFLLSDQRSRSTECYGTARSSSASPVREKPMSIRERAKNFTEATIPESKPAPPQKPAMQRMSQKSTSSIAAALSENPDSQGKLDIEEQIQTTAEAVITSKPDGQDIAAVEISVPKDQPMDFKVTDTEASKANQSTKPDHVEADISVKGAPDASEINNNVSLQPKGSSRAGSRSKKKKNREPTSPISPNSNSEVTALQREQLGDTEGTAPKQLTEKVSSPSDKGQRNMSDKQLPLDTKQKELEVPDEQKQPDSSFLKSIDKPVSRQEGLLVTNDEPDSGTRSSGTKKPVDKDPVSLPRTEEPDSGHSLVLTQEKEKSCKDSEEMAASSPSPPLERPAERTSALKHESPVEQPKLDGGQQSESKRAGKVRQSSEKDTEQTTKPQNKDKESINLAESKFVDILEKAGNTETHKTEENNNKQLLQPEDSGQGTSGTERSVGKEDERKSTKTENTRPIKDATKPESSQAEPNSGLSDPQARTQQASQTETHPTVCAVTPANEAVSETPRDKGPLKGETVTNVPPELQMKSTESPGTQTEPVVRAAEPQPNSVSVEKRENSPDESLTHGAHDQFASSKAITKATTAVEEITVKATNDTAVLITAQGDRMSEKEAPAKQPAPISVSKSVSSEGPDEEKNVTIKPPEVKISGDIIKLFPSLPQCEESFTPASSSDATSCECAGKVVHSPSDSSAAKPTINVVKKAAEKTLTMPVNELPPVANSDISLQPQLPTVKKEPLNNKPSKTLKAPSILEDNKQPSALRKLHFPQRHSTDFSKQQDAPSSWLDVDFPKRKLKVPEPKLTSSGSESNLLDTSGEVDDDNFVEKIKKLCAPFSLPPRKHTLLRPPQPPFALPAIKEDRFEKTFDPEEFKFGLRKNNSSFETAHSQLAKLKSNDTKSGLKPARASLADRSMLLSSLDTHSRLKDKTPVKDEEDVKEVIDNQVRVKSRLEGSCVFSSLTSSFRGKRNGEQTQADGTKSGDVSPSEFHQLSPPPLAQLPTQSAAATGPIKDTPAIQSPAPSIGEQAQAVEAVVSESGPPLPSFNDIKLPDYLEKYLPQVKPVQSTQGQEQVKNEVSFSLCYSHYLKIIWMSPKKYLSQTQAG